MNFGYFLVHLVKTYSTQILIKSLKINQRRKILRLSWELSNTYLYTVVDVAENKLRVGRCKSKKVKGCHHLTYLNPTTSSHRPLFI